MQGPGFAFAKVFDPFTPSLWGVLACFVVGFGLAFSWAERDVGDFEGMQPAERTVTSIYLTLAGMLTGGVAHTPTTVGGRIIFLGFGWLVTLFLAAYTANLAQLLVVSSSSQSAYTSLADFSASPSATVCVPTALRSLTSWEEDYPQLRGRMIPVADSAVVLDSVTAGLCTGGATSRQQLELDQSKGDNCLLLSIALLETVPLAMPACSRVHSALSELVVSTLKVARVHIEAGRFKRNSLPPNPNSASRLIM